MSNYRDDTQETIVISSFSFAKVTSGDVETLKIIDTVHNTVINSFSDALTISDEDQSVCKVLLVDNIQIDDTLYDSLHANNLVHETLKVKDATNLKIQSLEVIETITLADNLQEKIKTQITDRIEVKDNFDGSLFTQVLVTDKASIWDSLINKAVASSLISESLTIADEHTESLTGFLSDVAAISSELVTKSIAKNLIQDTLKIADQTLIKVFEVLTDNLNISESIIRSTRYKDLIVDEIALHADVIEILKNIQLISDTVHVNSEITAKHIAKNLISDLLFIEDGVDDGYLDESAWTTSTDGWSMSRYIDFAYEQLVVINGNLYGVNKDGIDILRYGEREVSAHIVTGQLDIGSGKLVHPLSMRFEYSLEGENKNIEVTVGTAQTGDKQQYTYKLPPEKSNHLTNGRVMFGRGLRGRHFDLSINMIGKIGYINDMNMDLAQTNRRI